MPSGTPKFDFNAASEAEIAAYWRGRTEFVEMDPTLLNPFDGELEAPEFDAWELGSYDSAASSGPPMQINLFRGR